MTPETVRPIVCEVGVLPRLMVPPCLPEARPRRWSSRLSAPARTSRSSMRLRVSAAAFHAALQLPALLGGRGRSGCSVGPTRDRPRQARLAGDAAADSGEGRLSVHASGGFRNHRVERLLLDGNRLRHSMSLMDAGVPLKNPCAGIAMGLIKEGDASRCFPTFWVTRTISATWISRSPARPRASPPADGHQDHLDHRGDHADRAGSGP